MTSPSGLPEIPVGIEHIALYTPPYSLDVPALARARSVDLQALNARHRLMFRRRAVMPPFEDAVTLATNAAEQALRHVDRSSIELLVVATESSVDYGKPVSSWVHRFCKLPSSCRNFEVKHMCYGGSAALFVALNWARSQAGPGKKALVVSADASRPIGSIEVRGEDLGELGAGACAAAAIVSREPRTLAVELLRSGFWGCEAADAIRPTGSVERIEGALSLGLYLDALDGCYESYVGRGEPFDFDRHFDRHIYHAPFPSLPYLAHKSLCASNGITDVERVDMSFDAKVRPSLSFALELGTAYGASPFVGLLGLLHADPKLSGGERVSIFSYGSGCQAELYSGIIGTTAREEARSEDFERALGERTECGMGDYEAMEAERARSIEARDYRASVAQRYAGTGRLVLERIEDYLRGYVWS